MSSKMAKGKEPISHQALLDEIHALQAEIHALQAENHTFKDEVQSLNTRLEEAEELRRAISEGDLDALVIPRAEGELIFTLDSADQAYRVLVETMNEGTATLASDGTILYCNRRFAELLRLPLQAVVGRTIYQFIMSESAVKLNALLAHKMNSGEINLQTAGGKPLPVYLSISSLKVEGSPNAWCLVVTDLTEQKKNEEIVAAERLARSIIEQAAEGIVVCDKSGKITHFSTTITKICECDPIFHKFEDLMDLRFSEGIDAGGSILPVSSALKGSTILGMEAIFERKDFQKFYLLLNSGPLKNDNGEIIGCVVTLTDITERKRAEEKLLKAYERIRTQSEELQVFNEELQAQTEELRVTNEALHESEKRFRTLAENSPDIIARFDRQNRHTYINPAAEEVYGLSQEEIIGKTLDELRRDPEQVRFLETYYEIVFATGKPETIDFQYTSPQGKEYYFNTKIVPEFVDGKVTSILTISHDITGIKKTETKLKETLDNLDKLVKERTAELEQEETKLLRYNHILEGINRILSHVVQTETEEELGNVCLSVALDVTGSQIGFVGEVGSDGLLHDIAISDMGWNQCTMYDKTGHRRPPRDFILHGLYGRVIDNGKGFFTNDPMSHPDSIGLPYGHPSLKSFLGVPLVEDGKVTGMLSVANREDGYICEQQEDLEAIAPTIAQVLQRKREEQERKKAEEALAKIEIARKQEIHHRIKNNLQVISSLLDLQAEQFRNRENIRDSDVLEAFRESQDRVISMALIHEELYKGGGFETLNFSPYIEELTENLFLTYRLGNADISLKTDLEENLYFDMDTAVPLGMIVNELVSNSLKHAFIGRDKGEIQIKLRREENAECINSIEERRNEDCESTSFTLTVSDNGAGIPEDLEIEDLDTLGFQLVTTLVDQLDGELELKRDNVTEFVIRFTVTEKNNQASTPAPQ